MGAVGAMKWWHKDQIDKWLDFRPPTLLTGNSIIMLSFRAFGWFRLPAHCRPYYRILPHVNRTWRGKARRQVVARINEAIRKARTKP